MIRNIKRFGIDPNNDHSGVVVNLSLPEFRIEIERWLDEFFDSQILTLDSGSILVYIFVGPDHSWKYEIKCTSLSDVSFLRLWLKD